MPDPNKAAAIASGAAWPARWRYGTALSLSSRATWENTGSLATKTGLYSFYSMFTIGIAKGRWATMDTGLQQIKDDYDHNRPLW